MFRLFDMLGRSSAMRALDEALRAAGVHPLMVPDPVKLTVIQLNKRLGKLGDQDAELAEAAKMLAYCMLGHKQFEDSNSTLDADCLNTRFESALEDGDIFDAKMILLVLYAGLISPEIADRIELEER